MTRPDLHTAQTLEISVKLSFEQVLEALEKGEIAGEHGIMRWGSNYTFMVSVTYQERNFLAIYKPRLGERPLWDFPDGTLCQRETAAYLVSEALGWHIVPPTVLREGPRGIGSVQVFIEHDPQQHYFTFEESMTPQLMRMQAFDAVINNADRKGGHCLLDPSKRIWGIDHGLAFHSLHKLRTVIWDYAGKPIPDDLLGGIERFCVQLNDRSSDIVQSLSCLLSDGEMQALRTRVQRLLDNGTYPMPGAGPNRPWPAV